MTAYTCYISGKIRGLSFAEYSLNFAIAEREVISLGYKPVNPTALPRRLKIDNWIVYMIEDLTDLCKRDAIYMQRNWRDSKGARVERLFAIVLGKKIIYQQA